jgi:hypothetical protein
MCATACSSRGEATVKPMRELVRRRAHFLSFRGPCQGHLWSVAWLGGYQGFWYSGLLFVDAPKDEVQTWINCFVWRGFGGVFGE